jgi:hypothetical protein
MDGMSKSHTDAGSDSGCGPFALFDDVWKGKNQEAKQSTHTAKNPHTDSGSDLSDALVRLLPLPDCVGTLLALLDAVRRLLELRGTEFIRRPDESAVVERVCGRLDEGGGIESSSEKGAGLLDCEED